MRAPKTLQTSNRKVAEQRLRQFESEFQRRKWQPEPESWACPVSVFWAKHEEHVRRTCRPNTGSRKLTYTFVGGDGAFGYQGCRLTKPSVKGILSNRVPCRTPLDSAGPSRSSRVLSLEFRFHFSQNASSRFRRQPRPDRDDELEIILDTHRSRCRNSWSIAPRALNRRASF